MSHRYAHLAFLARRWYWNQSFAVRHFLSKLPDIIVAIALGLVVAWFAAQGF